MLFTSRPMSRLNHLDPFSPRRLPLALSALALGTLMATHAMPAHAGTEHAKSSADTTAPADKAVPATAGKKDIQTTPLSPIQVNGMYLGPGDGYLIQDSMTATHTMTPLVNIPFTIQAMPIKLLNDQAARSLADVMRNAPGVSVQQGEGNRDEFYLRGVKTKSDFFVNGMRDDTEYFRDLYNVREVDVLQGPSALLFGRGDAGGAINLVTKKARREPVHEVRLDVGQWNRLRSTLDVGGSMGADAAWRVNAIGEHSGGYRDDFDLHRYGVNPVFAFWLGDDTRLDVGAEHFHEWQRADRGIPSQDGRPVDVPRSRFFGSRTQNVARATVDGFHVRLDHRFNDHLRLRNTLRGNRNQKFYRNMYPGSAVAADDTLTLKGYEHGNTRKTWQDQAELVAQFGGDVVQHQLLVGADYTWQVGDDWENKAQSISGVPLDAPYANGVYDKPARNNHAVGHEIGLYAQDRISFGEHWIALAGVRWDRFGIDAHYHFLPPAAATHHVDTKWSPRAGLIYKPVENDSIYVSVSKSFTPQGANIALSAKKPEGQDMGPEEAVNYEIGNKLDMLDGQLSLSVALFRLELSHVTAHDPNDPTRLVQTGKQRTRGAEITLNGQLTSRWKVSANYSRLDAQIIRATKDAPAGARVGLVPRQQFSLWTTYALDDHWGIGGGVVGQSRAYTSFSNEVTLHGYARADVMAWYQAGRYRIQLNVDNLFDRHYYASANGDNQIMPGAPRNAQLSFRLDF